MRQVCVYVYADLQVTPAGRTRGIASHVRPERISALPELESKLKFAYLFCQLSYGLTIDAKMCLITSTLDEKQWIFTYRFLDSFVFYSKIHFPFEVCFDKK